MRMPSADTANVLPYSNEYVAQLQQRATALLRHYASNTDRVAKGYMILGATLSVLSLLPIPILQQISQGLLVLTCTGIGWNLIDSIAGIFAMPRLWDKAQNCPVNPHAKTTLARLNALYSLTILPGLSAWGFATILESVKAIGWKSIFYAAGTVLGIPAALAGSAFAFAGGMFVAAAISGFDWYEMTQEKAPLILLQQKLIAYDALAEKITKEKAKDTKEPGKIQLLTYQQTEIARDITALACLCNQKKLEIPKKITNHPGYAAWQKTQPQPITDSTLKLEAQLHANALIQKQVAQKKQDTQANLIGGIGAVLFGLALLLPPAAVPLCIAGAICFAVSAVMKGMQLYASHQEKKAVKAAAAVSSACFFQPPKSDAVTARASADSAPPTVALLQEKQSSAPCHRNRETSE